MNSSSSVKINKKLLEFIYFTKIVNFCSLDCLFLFLFVCLFCNIAATTDKRQNTVFFPSVALSNLRIRTTMTHFCALSTCYGKDC